MIPKNSKENRKCFSKFKIKIFKFQTKIIYKIEFISYLEEILRKIDLEI